MGYGTRDMILYENLIGRRAHFKLFVVDTVNREFYIDLITYEPNAREHIRGLFKKYVDCLNCVARVGFKRIHLVSLGSYR